MNTHVHRPEFERGVAGGGGGGWAKFCVPKMAQHDFPKILSGQKISLFPFGHFGRGVPGEGGGGIAKKQF